LIIVLIIMPFVKAIIN